MDFFFDGSMLQNLFSELFGILVTIIVIDTLYEYRSQRQKNEYMKAILEGISRIHSNARTLAFGPAGGQAFLEIKQLQFPKHAQMLAPILGILHDYNREIESFIDRYSLLATPYLVHELRKIIDGIDSKLNDIAFIYAWQIRNGPLKGNDSVPQIAGDHSFESTLRATHLVPFEQQSISEHYKELRLKYDDLNTLITELSNKKTSFFLVVRNDSLLSGIFPSSKKNKPD